VYHEDFAPQQIPERVYHVFVLSFSIFSNIFKAFHESKNISHVCLIPFIKFVTILL